MQILHLITNLEGPGGAERMLARLVNHTPEHQHLIVSVLGARADVVELMTGTNFEVVPLNCQRNPVSFGLTALPRLHEVLGGRRFDVIQGWMYHGSLVGCLYNLASRLPTPLWLGIHHSLDALDQESQNTLLAIHALRPVVRAATGIVFCAQRSHVQHLEFGWRHPRCEVIPNGFDFPAWPPPPRLRGPASREFTLGAVGRLHPAKDYPNLFRAAAELMREYPGLRLRIAGKGLTSTNPEVAELLGNLGLPSDRVELLGQLAPAQMPAFYAGLDAYVLSSRNEGLPSSLIEAMAAGLPCVTTDVGDAGRALARLRRTVPPGDAGALAQALDEVLSDADAKRLTEGRQNRERVLALYSMTYCRNRYVDLWTSSVGLEQSIPA